MNSFSVSAIEDLYRQIDKTKQEVLLDSVSTLEESLNEKKYDEQDEQDYKIKSSYWKLVKNNGNNDNDNKKKGLPPKLECVSAVDNLVAVASSEKTSNLRIYGVDTEIHRMTHLSSISIPDIKSLEWLYDPTDDQSESGLRFLLTGHSDGIVNLIMVPLDSSSGVEHAQIIKQFNHKKQLLNYTDLADSKASIRSHIQSPAKI